MRENTKLRKREKSSRGITLIALVITIIVLLILVTVSITTLTGENGVLTKSSEAQIKTDIADCIYIYFMYIHTYIHTCFKL